MYQLIIVIITIGLFGLALLAQLNYVPAWTKTVDVDYEVTREGLLKLENAYNLYAQANAGAGPAVSAGAVPEALRPYLKFIPAAPRGMQWSYGQNSDDGTLYANMHFFCATPATASGITEGTFRGLLRVKATLSPEQYFVTAACNSRNTPVTGYSAATAVTMYVAYAPADPI